jgi:putative transposase
MRSIKVVNQEILRKEYSRILGPLEDRVRGIVVDILTGTEARLSKELHGIGLEVMRAVMELEVLEVVGPKGKHHTARCYNRWGTNPGSVVINGAKATCEVPRVVEGTTRSAYRLRSYELFRQTGDLIKRAYTDLIRGISTRRYAEGVESFVEGYGISASSISRHMVQATTKKVEELFNRSLAEVDLAVLMLDGITIGDHTVVIALGIDTKGVKHILGIRQGATENTDVVKALLQDIIERGISTRRPVLVVIDGGKALRRAVLDVFGVATPIQRCTVHKKRNVLSHLPQKHHAWVSLRLKQAYAQSKYTTAHKMLVDLAEQLDRLNPDAAKSLREGLEDTLTVQRLELPELLRTTLRSTNASESVNSATRDRSGNVKRWSSGHQVERWTAASVLENEKNFRRIKGYRELPVLIERLDKLSREQTQVA